MNLTNFVIYFKKVILPLLLVVGSLLFLSIGFINVATFQEKARLGEKKLPHNLTFNTSNYLVETGTYDLGTKDIFKTLPKQVATYKATFGIGEVALASLAQKFGISSPVSKQNHTLSYRQGNLLLVYDSKFNLLTYNQPQNTNSASVGFGDNDINVAKEHLKDLLGGELKFNGVTYTTSGSHAIGVSQNAAQLAIYHFQVLIGSQVLDDDNLVVLANNKQLVSLQVHPVKNIVKESSYLAKTTKEALADLNSHNYLLKYKTETAELAGEMIPNASFSKLTTTFVSQPDQSLIQPVFLLTGTSQMNKQPIDVEALLAAISGVGVNK